MDLEKRIQNYPMVDGNTRDSLESLVELYYQLEGYITSSNKMFWVKDKEKAQRGYQDIDLLAVNEKETHIVSVTSNLNFKIRLTREGDINEQKLNKTLEYFRRVEEYLKVVEEYRWMYNTRDVKRVIAYLHGYKTDKEQLNDALYDWSFELLSVTDIIDYLGAKVKELKKKGLNPNNDMMRMVQIYEIMREEK